MASCIQMSNCAWHVIAVLITRSCLTFCDPMWPARLLCPQDSPGKNTGVGCRFLLQGIFPTQGLNLPLLPWQVDSLPLNHQGHLGT